MRRRGLAVAGTGAALALALTACLAEAPDWRASGAYGAPGQEATAPGVPPPAASPSMRPAPAPWEEARATEVLLAHPALGRTVRTAYARAAGRPLRSAADLRVHTLIFRRHGCEAHRCLQLFVEFPGHRWLDVGRVIVDLSTGGVRVLKW
ncbi:hypothetical protein DQ384_07320 [Sphaerisporangium album]|uniref:Lipoprotein n=1 Tax=Sphaerisporangium album TaxID=509200 RepID=A0A367FPU5_9ACTN|nr:hypothetical protein [Sphaerisporangium album]RCG32301.1 hypothetical protein DQ384_07320 [Sphaerisporangium album]